MAAPDFADLEWTQTTTGGWTTEGTSAFWDHYNRDRNGFKTLGFSTSKPASKWIVVGPDIDDTNHDAFRTLIGGIHRTMAEARDRHQRALQEQQRRDAIREAERAQNARQARMMADALILEARSLQHSKLVHDARAAGQACLDKWGTLVHLKAKLADLVGLPLLTHAQIRLVYALITETERKAADISRRANIVQDEDCVTWADDVVERAVRYLTSLDADHAKLPNDEGWSGSDTGKGHWCVATLATDRPAALRLARTIVGDHREQLSAILTPQEMP